MSAAEGSPGERLSHDSGLQVGAMQRFVRDLADAERLSDVAPEMCATIAEAGGWDAVVIWSVVPFANSLQCVAYWELTDRPTLGNIVRVSDLRPGKGPVGEAWSIGATVIVNDTGAHDAPVSRAAATDGLTSAIISPCAPRGDVQGIVMAFSDAATAISPDAASEFEAFASIIALFMDRERSQRDHALDRVILDSQNEATLDALLVVGPDGSIVSSNQRFQEMWGLDDKVMNQGSDDAAVAAVVDQVTDPVAFEARIRYLYANPDEQGRDEITLKDGRVIDRWTLPQRHAGSNLLIGRAWFFRDITQQRRTERQDRFLANVTDSLTSTLDPIEAVKDLAALTVPTLADWCVIDLVEGPNLRRAAIAHDDSALAAMAGSLPGGSLVPIDPAAPRGPHRAVTTGQAEFSEIIRDEWLVESSEGNEEALELLRSLQLRSYLCMPLRARGRTIGAITLVTGAPGRTLGERDVAFARTVADRAALLVDNIRLFNERDHIARTLQESLLPSSLPEVPGIEMHARMSPGGEAYDVGGDFYDVFQVTAGTWALVIGDVCGKGPEAAALTSLARNTIRIAAMQARRPKRILSMLNGALLSHSDSGLFCTATVARVHRTDAGVDVTLSRGGHPPCLILRRDGDVTVLTGEGTLLGAVAEPKLADVSTTLAPGETMLLHTDGITEARNADGEAFGDLRLKNCLASSQGLSPREIVDRILSAVTDFAGASIRDDMAILAIRASEIENDQIL